MTYTYTTASLVKNELRVTTDFASTTVPSLDTINNWIEEESEFINHLAGKTYGVTEYTEVLDIKPGTDTLYLLNAPIVEVDSVKYSEYPLGDSNYSLSIEKTEDVDFTVYDKEGVIKTLSWKPQAGRKRVEVVYTAGSGVLPLIVQKLATKMVAKRVMDTIIEADLNEQKSGKTVAVGNVRITKSTSFGIAQYQEITREIKDLQDKIVGGTTAFRVPIHRI